MIQFLMVYQVQLFEVLVLEKISDFEALLCLTEVMGLESVQDLCKSICEPKKYPIKNGYKIIIDSLM